VCALLPHIPRLRSNYCTLGVRAFCLFTVAISPRHLRCCRLLTFRLRPTICTTTAFGWTCSSGCCRLPLPYLPRGRAPFPLSIAFHARFTTACRALPFVFVRCTERACIVADALPQFRRAAAHGTCTVMSCALHGTLVERLTEHHYSPFWCATFAYGFRDLRLVYLRHAFVARLFSRLGYCVGYFTFTALVVFGTFVLDVPRCHHDVPVCRVHLRRLPGLLPALRVAICQLRLRRHYALPTHVTPVILRAVLFRLVPLIALRCRRRRPDICS